MEYNRQNIEGMHCPLAGYRIIERAHGLHGSTQAEFFIVEDTFPVKKTQSIMIVREFRVDSIEYSSLRAQQMSDTEIREFVRQQAEQRVNAAKADRKQNPCLADMDAAMESFDNEGRYVVYIRIERPKKNIGEMSEAKIRDNVLSLLDCCRSIYEKNGYPHTVTPANLIPTDRGLKYSPFKAAYKEYNTADYMKTNGSEDELSSVLCALCRSVAEYFPESPGTEKLVNEVNRREGLTADELGAIIRNAYTEPSPVSKLQGMIEKELDDFDELSEEAETKKKTAGKPHAKSHTEQTHSFFSVLMTIVILAAFAAAAVFGVKKWLAGRNNPEEPAIAEADTPEPAESPEPVPEETADAAAASDLYSITEKPAGVLHEGKVQQIAAVKTLLITNTSDEKLDFEIQFDFFDEDGNRMTGDEKTHDHVQLKGVAPGMTFAVQGYIYNKYYVSFADCRYTVRAVASQVDYSLDSVKFEWADNRNYSFSNTGVYDLKNLETIVIFDYEGYYVEDHISKWESIAAGETHGTDIYSEDPPAAPSIYFLCTIAE